MLSTPDSEGQVAGWKAKTKRGKVLSTPDSEGQVAG